MWLMLLFIFLVIILIILDRFAEDILGYYNIFTDLISVIFKGVLILSFSVGLLLWLSMPFYIQDTISNYKAFKTTLENSRSNDFTQLERIKILEQIIKINSTIESHRTFHNSKWIGLWYSKQIADLEYIK